MISFATYSRKNPITAKLLAFIILVSLVIALTSILIQLYTSFNDDVSEFEKQLDQVRISILPTMEKSLWGFDQEQLHVQIQSVLALDQVIKVAVVWNDWNNVEQDMVVSLRKTANDSLRDITDNHVLIKEYPLSYSDEFTPEQSLGRLVITASLQGVYSRLWDRAWLITILQGTETLLVSLLILWLVRHFLTRHMESIARYARELNLDKLATHLTLDRPESPTGRPDELDNVVNGFNQMRETLLGDIEKRRMIEVALAAEKVEKMETLKQKAAAEATSRAKSQFLAAMSHEIRTPMNGVIGMLELLRDTPLNETQQHYLDTIHRSGEALLEIINDILDYSKIEAGKMELESISFDLEDLVEDCIQLFGTTANKNNIELIGSIERSTPLKLTGDPTRLRQIIINLLGNAFKFTDKGFVSLRVEGCQNNSTDSALLRFSITDTGIGIDKGSQQFLFDSFSQADSSTTRKYGGTGLGLTICKRIVEMMGGQIGVQSVKGQGSTFWFTAPLALVKNAESRLAFSSEITRELKDKKILIIEDQKELASVLQYHCKNWGMITSVAHNCHQAAHCLSKAVKLDKTYDIVLIDYDISDQNDLPIILNTLASPIHDRVKKLSVSKMHVPQDQHDLSERLLDASLHKPVSIKQLRQELLILVNADYGERKATRHHKSTPHSYAGLRVLVVEDNSVNQMVIEGLLNKLNINPDIVENGLEAVTALKLASKPYDVILMDCEMPEMDGFEATQHIRQHEKNHNLPAAFIIALTAHAMREHREAALACGMDYYVSKPVTMADLNSAFEKICMLKSVSQAI